MFGQNSPFKQTKATGGGAQTGGGGGTTPWGNGSIWGGGGGTGGGGGGFGGGNNNGGGGRRFGPVSDRPQEFFESVYKPVADEAFRLYEQGRGFTPYNKDRAANLTPRQNQAINTITGRAQRGNPMLSPAIDWATEAMRSGGMTPYNASAMGTYGDIQSGRNSVSGEGFYNNYARNPLNNMQSNAMDFWRGVANDNQSIGTNRYTNAQSLDRRLTNAAEGYGQFAAGRNAVDGGQFASLYDTAGQLSNSETNLADMASGRFLTEGNPYASAALEDAMSLARAGIASDAALAGRGGSPYHATALADTLGRQATAFAAEQYERDKNLMLGANQLMDAQANNRFGQQLGAAESGVNTEFQNLANTLAGLQGRAAIGQIANDNAYRTADAVTAIQQGNRDARFQGAGQMFSGGQQGFNNAMQARGAQSNIEGTNLANMFQAAQALGNDAFTGQNLALNTTGMVPALGAERYADPAQLFGAGSLLQDQRQAEIDADMAKHAERQEQDWMRLSMLNSILNGGSVPGQSIASESQSAARTANKPNPFFQTLGAIGSVGSALTGLGGGISSLFG